MAPMTETTENTLPPAPPSRSEWRAARITGSKIKRAREAAGWSVEDLARRLGCTGGSVRNWEHGTTLPDRAFRRPLADALGLDITTSEGAVR